MTVQLLRNARITHKAGEIVEVSPAEFNFLVSIGSAVEIAVNNPFADPKTPIKTEKRTKKK